MLATVMILLIIVMSFIFKVQHLRLTHCTLSIFLERKDVFNIVLMVFVKAKYIINKPL